MNINSIQNQKYTKSFCGVRIPNKQQAMFQIKSVRTRNKYLKHAEKLENMKIDLGKMIQSWTLTPLMIYVLKNFLSLIGEKETQDFTVDFEGKKERDIFSFPEPNHRTLQAYDFVKYQDIRMYNIDVNKAFLGYFINAGIDGDKKENLKGTMKEYEGFKLPSPELVLSVVDKTLKNDIEELAAKVAERIQKGDMYKTSYYPQISADKRLSESSLVCTLDEIIDCVNKNKKWDDYNQVYKIDYNVFNVPVTKDGETLLMALAHVLPDAENIDKYSDFIDELSKNFNNSYISINFNQKDSMGISFIEHVLNSKNVFLLSLISNAKDLKYEPELENVFNSIQDEKFKEMVLKLDLFNNLYNIRYKTILGQPNPKL